MNNIKKRVIVLALVAIMCAITILPTVLASAQATISDTTAPVTAPTTVSVSGSATISVRPNIAYLYLGVTTEDKEASAAQGKNSEKMAQVIAKLSELGITEDNVSTESVTIYPNYDYSSSGSQTIKGYTANQTVKITVYEIDLVGSMLDDLVAAGANQVNNIEFSVDDRSAAYEQAMALSVKNAEAKAAALAAAAGKTIVRMVSITEEANYYGMYYAKDIMPEAELAGAGTQLMPSWVDVSANLTIIFEMD